MEFKPLNRTADCYQAVLTDWLATPDLTISERSLVETLAQGLEKSPLDFDQLRRIAVSPAFLPTLKSAAAKAIASGRLTSWSDYDHIP